MIGGSQSRYRKITCISDIVRAAFVILVLSGAFAATMAAGPYGEWSAAERSGCLVWNIDPQPRETVTWSGACVDGKASGRGVYVWRFLKGGEWAQSRYEGDMVAGRNHGRGVFEWSSGNRYKGEVANGLPHGVGVKTWVNGERYEGDWAAGKRHGYGAYTWINGNRYEGDWVEDRRNGQGIFIWSNGSRYEGPYLNDMRHGEGLCRRGAKSAYFVCCAAFDNQVTCE